MASAINHRTAWRAFRFAALTFATVALVLGVTALAITHALWSEQQQRDAERAPISVTDAKESTGVVEWLVASDTLDDGRQFGIVFVKPVGSDAPVPPGVQTWPKPGETLLSPALRDDGASEDIERRYGRSVGTIGLDGLVDPNERLAYVNPVTESHLEQSTTVRGFGADLSSYQGDIRTRILEYRPEWVFQLLVLGSLILPAMGSLLFAAGIGPRRRNRHGADEGKRNELVAEFLKTAMLPILLGSSMVFVGTAVVATTGARIPYSGYRIAGADLLDHGVLILSAMVIGAGLAMIVVAYAALTSRHRPSLVGSRLATFGTAVFPIGVGVAVVAPGVVSVDTNTYQFVRWSSLAVIVLCLPAVGAVLKARAGRRNRSKGGEAPLTRDREHRGGISAVIPVIQIGVAIIVGLVITLDLVALQTTVTGNAANSQATMDRIGASVVEVKPRGNPTAEDVSGFIEGLSDDISVVITARSGDPKHSLTVFGSCTTFVALSLSCPQNSRELGTGDGDARMQEMLKWNMAEPDGTVTVVNDRHISRTYAKHETAQLFLINGGLQDLSIPGLKKLSYESFSLGARVDVLGSAWPQGAAPRYEQTRWSVLFGVITVVVLAGTGALVGGASFLRRPRALRRTSTAAVWRRSLLLTFGPVLMAVVVGAGLGLLLLSSKNVDGWTESATDFMMMCGSGVGVVTVIVWIWTALAATRWRSRQSPSI